MEISPDFVDQVTTRLSNQIELLSAELLSLSVQARNRLPAQQFVNMVHSLANKLELITIKLHNMESTMESLFEVTVDNKTYLNLPELDDEAPE